MAQTNEDSLGMLYHPLRGEQLENPYPFYARARQEEPIFFSPELDTWVVTRYEDVLSILNQPHLFSSKNALRPVVKFSPAVLAELSKGYPLVPNAIDSDGKEHVRFRSAVSKAFVPKRIRQLEPFIREVATSLVDAFIEDHQSEFISQFAYPLPLEVVLLMIGVPKEDMALAKEMSDSLSMLVNSPLPEEQQVECARGFVSFQHYFIRLVNERRRAPREDLLSDLLETPPGERPFDEAQLAHLLSSMVVAGHQTVTHLIGKGIALFLPASERWEALCAHAQPHPHALEEILPHQ